jgi:glycosyltransferase involved in cell wall biosynthesis
MKVIFSHNTPFYLAHGGQQTLIESLMRELAVLGVDVQPERWWDPHQNGDILHFIGRPSNLHLAKEKGLMTIMTENFDTVASESNARILMRSVETRLARKFLPGFNRRISFYQDLDALVYVVPHELEVVSKIYGAAVSKGFIIPHGLEAQAIDVLAAPQVEGDYLVSVGTICPRKNTVLLARCAKEAKVPIVFLGKAFSNNDPYFMEFRELIDGTYVRYQGYVSESKKYEILRGARGFALLSLGESGCIAIYEAAAAGLPLFLSDLPWARNGYPATSLVRLTSLQTPKIIRELKSFFSRAHRGTTMTFPVGTWADIAKKYLNVYEKLLGSSLSSADWSST